MTSKNLLFIDVAESTPLVKQEQEETTVPESTSDMKVTDKTLKNDTKDTLQCPKCDQFKTTSKERLKQHVRTKHREDKYKCGMCHYTTYHSPLFREHLNRHKGIKPFKCELCPYTSVSKKYVKLHQQKHRVCACGTVCRNAHEYQRHARGCGAAEPHPHPHPRACASRCTLCDKPYADRPALDKHRSTVQLCDLCGEQLCSAARRRHMTRAHNAPRSHAHKYRFKCALCPWSSSLQQKILLHLIHHPHQKVDDTIVDVTVLRSCGILNSLTNNMNTS